MTALKNQINDLVRVIQKEIRRSERKAIPFSEYMSLCLYHDLYGYYCRDSIKVGKEGDFYTSASIGTIMGEILGASFIRTVEQSGWGEDSFTIVEWGGGTGKLAGDVLDTIEAKAPDLYRRLTYQMVERSPFHRSLQQQELSRHSNVRYKTPEEWEQEPHNSPVIVFSNELLDAFPVHRVVEKDGVIQEVYVGWDETAGWFAEQLFPIEPGPLMNWLKTEQVSLREGQAAEINVEASSWIRRIGAKIKEGQLLTIDYGDLSEELYGPHRMQGTLMCYRNHQAFHDPYAYPGEQDMTAHVNFTSCIRAGEEAGFASWRLKTQKQFLIDEGVLELLASHDGTDPFSPQARRNRAIRQLLLTDQMSELFKVLIQTK